MNKLNFIAGLLLITCLAEATLPQPGQAGRTPARCQVELDGAVSTIVSNRNITFEGFFEQSISGTYSRYPQRRPTSIFYAFSGDSDWTNVYNSPILLRGIAHNIMSNCNAISMVGFGTYHTDDGTYFYLTEDDHVEEAECILTPRSGTIRLRWGQVICL